MRVLYIDEIETISKTIAEYLELSGCELEHIDNPEEMDDVNYMSLFTGKIASFMPDCVFSTVFYPILSLACGVSGIRYVVWIVPGYNENNYSYQINNDRDRIYVADKRLFSFYNNLGLKTIKYLPISQVDLRAIASMSHEENQNEEESLYDVSVISQCTYPAGSIADVMPLLKDSTKGYLDGSIEARKSDLRLTGLFDLFSEYAQEDIKNNYPMSCDSYESNGIKYDNRVFFPHIDRSVAISYVLTLINLPDVRKMALYSPCGFPYYNEKMDVISLDSVDNVCEKMSPAKIIVCIPPFQDGFSLPPYVYELISRGFAVIMPNTIDKEIADEYCIPTFRNSNSYMKIVRHYINSDDALDELKKHQYEAMSNMRRLKNLASVLFDK